MLRYMVKRLLLVVPVILGVLVIIFTLKVIMPGDPVDSILPMGATEEEREAKREELGLNDPLFLQFFNYVKGIVIEGDFGRSYKTNQPIAEELMNRFPLTVKLTFGSVFLGVLLAIPLGVLAAVKQYTWVDSLVLVISMSAASMPNFWFALMLLSFFSAKLRLLPALFTGGPTSWVMPIMVIALGTTAGLTRITRSSMLEVIRQEYILTARAKGQKEGVVIFRHALRNALIPIAVNIGNQVGIQLGGALIVETIFGMPGIGKYITDAVSQRNFPAIQGGVILLAFVFVILNLIIDISYTFIDPRLKSTLIDR